MTRRTRSSFAALLGLALGCSACGGGTESPDTGSLDAPMLADAGVSCATDDECEDGLACNGEARCAEGRCVAGEALRCDDAVACTMDFCSEELRRCVNRALDADLDGAAAASCLDARGVPLGADCDDADARVYPGASELCDAEGLDEDCDPTTRGGRDGDGDGFEDIACCNGSSCGDDCNDAVRGASPAATEVCNGVDDDCDGNIDEGVLVTVYRDADGDGRGVTTMSSMACATSSGYAAEGGDCDDTSALRSPALPEVCDGIDNDCDGTPDPADAPIVATWYEDGDGDGFGDPSRFVESCAPPVGSYSLLGTDCDDATASRHPAQAELCNGIDDDCNGAADFAIAPGDTEDDDLDGRADARCSPRPMEPDCDDRDASSGPGASEVCDGRDNDCDGSVDEDVATTAFFRDEDGDGYGSESSGVVFACAPVSGYVPRAGDCDDGTFERGPGADEGCNGTDDDCDRSIDEGSDLALCMSAGLACVRGACRARACEVGFGNCNGDPLDGCEVDTRTDPAHCSGCGSACPRPAHTDAPTCTAGACSIPVCSSGYRDCDGDLITNGCETSGACPGLRATPTMHDFGSLASGGLPSEPFTFVIGNAGDLATPTPVVSIGGTHPGDFTIASNTCTGPLPAAGGCSVGVRFWPSSTGPRNGTLIVDAMGGGLAMVPLSGTGRISITPTSHLFATTMVGASTGPQSFTITNPGTVDSGALAVSLTGTHPGDFTLTSTCPATLAGGATCTATVAFAPTAAGGRGATLQAVATVGGTVSSVLFGTGSVPIALGPSSRDFGGVALGASSGTVSFTISNPGTLATGPLGVTMVGAHPGDFPISMDTCIGVSLPPGGSCTLAARFAPTAAGPRMATLHVIGSPGGTATSALMGTGTAPITVSPPTQGFGSFAVGSTSARFSFTVSNPGTVATGMLGVSFSGTHPGDFAIASNACAVLGPGGSCMVEVTFSPTAPGPRSATLQITGAPGGTAISSLTGIGAVPTRIAALATWGDANDDWPVGAGRDLDVTTDSAGNIYLLASYGSDLSVAGTSYTTARFGTLVISYTASGTLRWVAPFRRPSGSGDASLVRILHDPTTNAIYVTGSGWGGDAYVGATLIGSQNGNCTPIVARLSVTDGSLVWGRTFPTGSTCASAPAMTMSPSGSLVIAGSYTAGSHTMDTYSLGSSTDWNGYVATMSPATGVTTSLFGYGGAAQEETWAVAVLPSGDIVTGGYYSGGTADLGGFTFASGGSTDAYWVQFTAGGTAVRAAAFNGVGQEGVQDIRVAPGGDFFLCGLYDSSTNVHGTTLSGSSFGTFLARVSGTTGSPVWVTGGTGGGNAPWGMRRLAEDASGNLRVAWSTSAVASTLFAGVSMPLAGEARVARVSAATGAASLLTTLDSSAGPNPHVNAMAVLPDGRTVVVGWMDDAFTIDGATFPAFGSRDHYMAVLSPSF